MIALTFSLVFAIIALQLTAAQQQGFIHPRTLNQTYCVTTDVISQFDSGTGKYSLILVDGICSSGFVFTGSCTDGKQNGLEQGIDCGGSCPASCRNCIAPSETFSATGVPTSAATQTGPKLLQLADQEIYIRAYDTLFEYADNQGVNVTQFDTSDEALAAVAWYVNEHMQWRSDSDTNPNCINGFNALGYSPGWDFPIPASYTARYTGVPACSNCSEQFCGDCEDHAILRQALARKIGVNASCVWDGLDLQSPGRHEYNIILYKSKFRLMDYGTVEANFNSTWFAHETQDAWNYFKGPRDTSAPNYASSDTHNYVGNPTCPSPWNLSTYFTRTCK